MLTLYGEPAKEPKERPTKRARANSAAATAAAAADADGAGPSDALDKEVLQAELQVGDRVHAAGQAGSAQAVLPLERVGAVVRTASSSTCRPGAWVLLG